MKETSSSKEKQKNGGSSDVLFPRLHVKETRNNGPRAPPRNKMALYEQFTIPSHRFQQTAQSQQQQIAQSFIPQSFAGGYYMPYYMTPPIAFQPMNMMMGQQFLPNQTNFDVESDQGESRRVPGAASVGENKLLHVSSLQSKTGSARGRSKIAAAAKDDQEDFAVPTYSSAATTVLPPLKQQQQQQLTSNVSVPNSTISTADERQGSERKQDSALKLSEPSNLEAQAVHEVPASVNEEVQDAAVLSSLQMYYHSPSNSIESNEGNGRIDNQSEEDPTGPSPQEEAETDDSETSVLENTAVPHLSSKDIIFAVGDEHFWKMRKSMQRQQNIFQKQLFELHRLTKVQQLMAAAGLRDPEENQRQINTIKSDQRVIDDSKKTKKKKSKTEQQEVSNEADPEEKEAPVESSPRSAPPEETTNPAISAAETSSYDHYRAFPPPPPSANMGYATYASYGAMNQWYAPLPVQFPYHHQQHFAPPGFYNTPYGPVYGAPPPMPFIPFSGEQRLQDPSFNVNLLPPQAPWPPPQQQQQLQAPPNYFPDPGFQWMRYMNSSASMGGFKENPQVAATGSSSQPRMKEKQQFQSQVGSSSAGFSLIQRSSGGNKSEDEQKKIQQQQQQQQQKLVGKFVEARHQTHQNSSGGGNQKHGLSPYSRPSGFHAVSSSDDDHHHHRGERSRVMSCSGSSSSRVVKVIPRAAMVTPESAAEILHSIRQERLD